MADRKVIFGTGLRMLLQGGSVAHLMKWAKDDARRELEIRVSFPGGQSQWTIRLHENDSVIADVSSESFEGCTLQAVTILGRR